MTGGSKMHLQPQNTYTLRGWNIENAHTRYVEYCAASPENDIDSIDEEVMILSRFSSKFQLSIFGPTEHIWQYVQIHI